MIKQEKLAAGTLVLLLVMCVAIVTLGGYVRLSGSGLSIPEWPFFTISETVRADGSVERQRSIFPPSTEDGWQTLRSTFVAKVPGDWAGIAMKDFKRMFWTEWSHRGTAKLIGLVYIAYMIVVFRGATMRRKLGPLSVAGLVVLALQAVIGGIVVLFHLEAAQIALHLLTAFVFTGIILWSLMLLLHPPVERSERKAFNPIFRWAILVTAVLALQIFSGGLMAGSLAGFQLNTWPKMGEVWVPGNLTEPGAGFFRNFTENIIMIQFFHRWFAFGAALLILMFVFRCATVRVSEVARWGLRALFTLVALQILLGIFTLLEGVQTHLALTHQAVGLFLILNCVVILYETNTQPVLLEEALADEEESANQESGLGNRGPVAHGS